ncbi:MAG: beta-lactamase [Chitinophagaceae bacterium]|nr:beta-lactamase [Chitinophagaceae bacterium]
MIACSCEVCTSPDKKDKRLRSSILVQSKTTTLVVDTTPDFRYQMLRADVKHLDAVVFTHPHKDHIAGLDDVRAYNFITHKPMEIFANPLTEEALRREFMYAFTENKYPGIPKLNINAITTAPFMVGDIPIIPIVVYHLNLPVLGFRFGKFTYITDANRIEENERQKIRGSEVIVLNALRKEKHISHFTLDEAVAVANELNIPTAYFTHMSHQMGKHADVNKSLPANRQLAWDGLELYL